MTRETDTTIDPHSASGLMVGAAVAFLRLIILAHPDLRRVGVEAQASARGEWRLGRLEPGFDDKEPLGDTSVSRTPATLTLTATGLTIAPGGAALHVDGQAITRATTLAATRVEAGFTLRVGKRVLLWVDLSPGARGAAWFGRSRAAVALEEKVARLAGLDGAVLIRGETGSGKELVAAHLHDLGPRARRPFVPVNLATILPTTIAAALFGHVRGAFTGADADSVGLFGQADRGTLFLDEVGAAPLELQDALLRAVELGEILAVGATQPRRVSVRIVSATDANLEAAVSSGGFRRPLLYRLATHSVEVPPLSERRADIAPLFLRFVREELRPADRARVLDTTSEHPWLPAATVEALLTRSYPGNVRELRSLAIRLASDYGALPTIPATAVMPPGWAQTREPPGLTPERVREAMVASQFVTAEAARSLGVSNATLHDFIERTGAVRRAVDLTRAELESVLARPAGDVARAAEELGVSERALRLRLARERQGA